MVEKDIRKKENVTLGFSVSGAPLWLVKALSQESKQYYKDVYWPVLVGWYRKAQEFDNIVRSGMPAPDGGVEFNEEVEEIKKDDRKPKLFGQ
tara:strand:- start:152 stop:427 length:276 start_codon:yes stop_codon:yes gene_type:complete